MKHCYMGCVQLMRIDCNKWNPPPNSGFFEVVNMFEIENFLVILSLVVQVPEIFCSST